MFHALIMAGGSGTRLWPLSRKLMPKQALALLGDRTMFQVTVERLASIIPIERVHVVTNAQMAEIFQLQLPGLPEENFVIEPSAKDSGPAAALGIARILRIDPDATIAILSADHHIGNVDGFLRTLNLAHQVAQRGYIVTLGITPTSPSTGSTSDSSGSPRPTPRLRRDSSAFPTFSQSPLERDGTDAGTPDTDRAPLPPWPEIRFLRSAWEALPRD